MGLTFAETIAARERLPEFSREVYDRLNALLYAEPWFSDVLAEDLAGALHTSGQAVGGALEHLIEAQLVSVEDTDINHERRNFLHTYAHDDGFVVAGVWIETGAEAPHEEDTMTDPATPTTKHCPRCASDKPLAEFCKNSTSKDGLSRLCRTCVAEYSAERRIAKADTPDAKAKAEAKREARAAAQAARSKPAADEGEAKEADPFVPPTPTVTAKAARKPLTDAQRAVRNSAQKARRAALSL